MAAYITCLWIYLMKPDHFKFVDSAQCNAWEGALKGAKLFGVNVRKKGDLETFLDELRGLASDQLDSTKFPHSKLRMFWLHVLCELSKDVPWDPRSKEFQGRLETYKKAYEHHLEDVD